MAEPPITLNDDGTVEFSHDGNAYTLRRPKLGEVARFREQSWKVDDETETDAQTQLDRLNLIRTRLAEIGVLALSEDGTEWESVTPAPKLSDEDNAEVLDLGNQTKKLTRETYVSTEERRLRLVVDIINTLGDGPKLEADVNVCEAWLASPSLATTLVHHFRTKPFPSGVS